MVRTDPLSRSVRLRALLCVPALAICLGLILALAACSDSTPSPADGGQNPLPAESLIGSDGNGDIWLLDKATGSAVRLLDVSEAPARNLGPAALDYVPGSSTLFASVRSGVELYRVSLSDGNAVYEGDFAWNVSDMALNPAGDLLYAVGNGDGSELDTWELAGGTSNRISWLSQCCQGGAITFAGGQLYVSFEDTLYRMDPTDASVLETIPFQYAGAYTAVDPAFPIAPYLQTLTTLADGSVVGLLVDGPYRYLVQVNVPDAMLTLISRAPDAIESFTRIPPEVTLARPAPSPVTGYAAASGLYSIAVSWAESFLATSYRLYWSDAPGIDTANPSTYGGVQTGLTGTSYEDLTATGPRYYAVIAENTVGDAAATAEFSGTPGADAAVAGLVAGEQLGSVWLQWNRLGGAATYTVYRAVYPGDPVTAGSPIATGVSGTSYRDLTVVPGTTYDYAVRGANTSGIGQPSAISTLTYGGLNLGPSSVSAVPKLLRVALSWLEVPGATSYSVYWNTTGTLIDPATPSTYEGSVSGLTQPRYNHSGLDETLTYYYAVTAVNADASPAVVSTPATASATPLGAPTGLRAQVQGQTALRVSWDAVAGANRYNVYWNTSGAAIDPAVPSTFDAAALDVPTPYLDLTYPGVTGTRTVAVLASDGTVRSRPSAPVSIPDYLGAAAVPFAPLTHGSANLLFFADDQVSGPIDIGFSFTFFGVAYTQLQVSSNGFVTFDLTNTYAGCCQGAVLPSVNAVPGMVALAWTDLYPPGSGTVQYETLGQAPNRVFVLTYTDVAFFLNNVPYVTTQLQLYETSNRVEVHTTSLGTPTWPISQGVVNGDGTAGIIMPGRSAALFSLSNDAVRFTTSP